MEFFAACYREEDRALSLLLQQYQCAQGQIVFACICEDRESEGRAGAYITERFLTWFRGLHLKKLMRNRERRTETLPQELGVEVREILAELEAGSIEGGSAAEFALILCIEDVYVMITKGKPNIYLLNTAFGKAYVRRLGGSGIGEAVRGSLQPDIGLLLATEGFYEPISETVIRDSLFIREIVGEKQMERRLAELGKESKRLGGRGVGAIMLRLCPEKGESG